MVLHGERDSSPFLFQGHTAMTTRLDTLRLRARIIRAIRDYFDHNGFLEVETPQRIPSNAPEEFIDPVKCGEFFLHTSPEICMKRLLCKGYPPIYQISHCWRDGERGSCHIPEFTMLEWYRPQSDYYDLMQDCRELLAWIATSCFGNGIVSFRGEQLNLLGECETITVHDALKRFAAVTVEDALRNDNFDEIMVTQVEPALISSRPMFLVDYPAETAALARLKAGDQTIAERFELYLGGVELANGFSELTDPDEQRERFIRANRIRQQRGKTALPLPERFLAELAAMPPSAGIALGIDRLVMICADAERIDEVVAFTPEEL